MNKKTAHIFILVIITLPLVAYASQHLLRRDAPAAATCPYFDQGTGDDDGLINDTITISASRSLAAENYQADLGVIDCSQLDFRVTNNAKFTLEPFVDDDAEYDDDFGVTLLVKSMTIDSGSSVVSDALGYRGSNGNTEAGFGPGGASNNGTTHGGGGGHGGIGGNAMDDTGGQAYGSYDAPTMLGSGGSSGNSVVVGGSGGGAVMIFAEETITNNGIISANGGNGDRNNCEQSGGGSGGSVYLKADNFTGSGIVRALGGNGGLSCVVYGGAGAGGRIKLEYSSTNTFSGAFSARRGSSEDKLTAPFAESGTVAIVNTTTNDLYIPSGEQMWRADPNLEGSHHRYNNVTVSNGALWYLKGFYTNNTDGVGFNFSVNNFTIDTGGVVSGEGLGYKGSITNDFGDGPGGGGSTGTDQGGGGGYGGVGGVSSTSGAAGPTYGSFLHPLDLGSGGGASRFSAMDWRSNGGGAVRIDASQTISVNGSINMNGKMALRGDGAYSGGAGSGGSVYLSANELTGAGPITANGGAGLYISLKHTGGGGGGRIALYHVNSNSLTGTVSVNKGNYGSPAAENGTISTGGYPSIPNTLLQYQSDGLTELNTGSVSNDSSVILKFNGQDGDSSDSLRAEVEVREVGTEFTDVPTVIGDIVPYSGTEVSLSATQAGLSDAGYYHWQGRVCDDADRCSQWVSYGGNPESEADFTVTLNKLPDEPVIPESSPFINEQSTNDSTPSFLFSQSDPDETNQVKYRIQVDDTDDFSSPNIDYSSALSDQGTASFTVGQSEGFGTYILGSFGQTLAEGNHYWRIKTIDSKGAESDWVIATGSPAFIIDITSPTNEITTAAKAFRTHGTTHTDDSQVIWFNRADMYFSWETNGDTSGLKGYCLYVGQDIDADASTQKGILGTSPVSTTGSNCQFIVDEMEVDFANSALTGIDWLQSSSSPYYFKIRPIDMANNVGTTDTESSTFSFYFDNTAPVNVKTISAASGSLSNIADMTFYWPTSGPQAASDGASSILGYQYAVNSTDVWRGTQTDPNTGLDFIPPDFEQPFALDPDIVGDDIIIGSNVLYFRTVDIVGNASTFTTAAIEYGGEAPAFADSDYVTITPSTNTQNSFAFSWPAATPSEGRTITSYYYMVNTPPPSQFNTITSNSTTYVPTTGRSIPASTLTNVRKGSNSIYVVAVDDAGNYSQSNYIVGHFTLDSSLPDAPQSVVILDASIKSASLWRAGIAWGEPQYIGAGGLSYLIERSEDGLTWAPVTITQGKAYLDTLEESQPYYWRVGTMDSSDESQASPSYANAVTLTPKGTYTEPAELTSGPATSSITTKRATITWTTSRASDSKVAIGTQSGKYDKVEPSDSTQTTDHSLALSNLKPGTEYYYIAKWTDEDGNTGVSKEKTFKTDPPPTVKNVQVRNIGIDSALVNFTTLGASSASVNYGTSVSFGGKEEISTSSLETTYSIQLNRLADGTKYYYMIQVTDSEGDVYDGTILNFETLPRPRVSNITVQQVADSAQASIQVNWESNTSISSIVTFAPVSNPEHARDAVDIKLVNGEHSMVIPGLIPETPYTLTVKGRDHIGNEAVSEPINFTTATDTRPPYVYDLIVESTNATQTGDNSGDPSSQLVVSWTTDEPATSQVEYGDGTGASYSQLTQEDTTLSYNHLVIISGLSPSKVYHLRGISKDSAGNESRSIDTVTITPKAADNAFDLVISNLREVFGFALND